MSKIPDKWHNFITTIEDGLGGYEPVPLIAEAIKTILNNSYEGMIVVDRHGNIAFMERPTEELLGLSPGGARNRPFSDFFTGLLPTEWVKSASNVLQVLFCQGLATYGSL